MTNKELYRGYKTRFGISIMHSYRSHNCADLNKTNVGSDVRLSGWVHRIRDHGGVLFVDLRDHYGITQVLCDPDSPVFSEMEKVRSEWCIRIDGNVRPETKVWSIQKSQLGKSKYLCVTWRFWEPLKSYP